ncbi:CsbD family protein [Corynebacterium aquatimens]|uniref:tRNA-specific adenosine deaminase n=2 Tax=Corynebacterium aquatimens TaxID=1190508 RepID=A0A931E2W2_9CORY|nr:tRNA(Arg) A34 adenosine deaminase TadA/uncharacterized protein YjbJ (UPF0337 family) [Corynebacterium aquatimens]
MQLDNRLDKRLDNRMQRALDIARTTPDGDIPVGAVVYGPGGEELGVGTNRRQASCDPTAHAEVEAIRAAASALGTWRLDGCELVVTLEPCTMCAGAILGARIESLVFGAYEPKTGAVGSVLDALRDPHHLHTVEVRGGIRERECAELLHNFFRPRRTMGRNNYFNEKETIMGLADKAESLKGDAKEALGDATDNNELKNEGKADQLSGDIKDKLDQAGDAIKDKANEVAGKIQDARENN